MDPFPVAPEMMQAFPLGALNLLVSVVSSIAAQHGVDSARRVCSELATNEALWAYIASCLANAVDVAGNRMAGTDFGGKPVTDLLRSQGDANSRRPGGQLALDGEPLNATEPAETEAAAMVTEPGRSRVEHGPESTPRRAGPRKPKIRRKPKTTGTE